MKDNWILPPQVSELATLLEEKGQLLKGFPILPEEAIQLLTKWYEEGEA